MGRRRHDLIPPFWRRPEKDLTEGLQRRDGQREEGATGWEPLRSPSSSWVRREMRSRSEMKAYSGRQEEAGSDPERVSEHSLQ